MSRFILAPNRPELQGPIAPARRGFLAKLAGLAGGAAWFGNARRAGAAPASTQGLDPYIGEIAIVAFNFAPRGWALCNGQILPIVQYQPLFSLLGITYGGNGVTTFALPNLQSRFPLSFDTPYPLGSAGGEASHVLTVAEMPAHSHTLTGDANLGTSALPGGLLPARNAAGAPSYGTGTAPTAMSGAAIGPAGGGLAHNNMPPYLTLNFIIALSGIFPPQP